MANNILLKRSAVPGKVPTTTDVELGSIAINTYDGKLFIKKDNGAESIVEIGASGSSALTIKDESSTITTTANTISFVGTGVTASGTGSNITVTIPGAAPFDQTNVAITGGSINNTAIGSVTPNYGVFTSLSSSTGLYVGDTTDSTATTNGSIHTAGGLGVEKTIRGNVIISTRDASINGMTVGLGGGNNTLNLAIGAGALVNNTSGTGNFAIGTSALGNNTTGGTNFAIGTNAIATAAQSNNFAIGINALQNCIQNGHTAIGNNALQNMYYGLNNLAVGSSAGLNLSNSTIINATAMQPNGSYIIAVPGDTPWTTLGWANNNAGTLNQNMSTTVAPTGTGTAYKASTGNTLFGSSAMSAATDASYNVCIGAGTLLNMTSGNNNTAIGQAAMRQSTIAHFNTAVGSNALRTVTTGQSNIGIGYGAAYGSSGGAGGLTTGSNNIHIGYRTLPGAAGNSSEIVIGNLAVGMGSNTTVIGNSTTSLTKLFGKVLISSAPASSIGATGDVAGMISADSSYIYHCIANYDGTNSIWKRIEGSTW